MSARIVSFRSQSPSSHHTSVFFADLHAPAWRRDFLHFTVLQRQRERIAGTWTGLQLICQHTFGPPTTLSAIKGPTETGFQSFPQNQSLPPVLPKRKKRPFVSPRKKLSPKEIERLEQHPPRAPKNGMLVEELIPVAHEVMATRNILYEGVEKLMKVLPVYACDFCLHIHVGPHGHHIRSCVGPDSNLRKGHHFWVKANIDDVLVPVESFHLFDRLARRIKHDQRFQIARLPAIVELCIQAGVNLPEYPTLRRTHPIKRPTKSEELDWDEDSNDEGSQLIGGYLHAAVTTGCSESLLACGEVKRTSISCQVDDELPSDAKQEFLHHPEDVTIAVPKVEEEIGDLANRTLKAWSALRQGVKTLMKRYLVKACGYCPEVHVGPCGHGARVCAEYKHQWRKGQHGWQEAALDDIIPPKFVWHVPDKDGPPMVNELKRFYGQAPAVVELCVQGGASIPDLWKPMMRLDVVIPTLEEFEAVA